MSSFFIKRPVLTSVLGILIIIIGLVAAKSLPIAQFPRITPPTVVVTASYPGADAKTIADTVIAPIEAQISGAEHLIYTYSYASGPSGAATIVCVFEVGTNIDIAQNDISNRVNISLRKLPEVVKTLGVTTMPRAPDMLMQVALFSPDGKTNDVEISNYVKANVIDEIKRIPGAGQATIMGTRNYSMRVWLDTDKMGSLGITVPDVNKAINEQNIQVSPGRVGMGPSEKGQKLTYMLSAHGLLVKPEEFENIILRANNDGSVVMLKDVARVELGAENYEFFARVNGKPAVMIAVYAQAGANALETAATVQKTMAELSKSFPQGISYSIPNDTTIFVKLSIQEVFETLAEAIALVVLVIFVFLQSWRASLIASIAIPISLLGAFIGMYMLGFSINTLTLFGLILAIGIVVDDAIIVVENMKRVMEEEGVSPFKAAILSMHELTEPIISVVLVLCVVFIPSVFMGGMTGLLYKQFAVTIAISVIFSGLVALTITPALGALFLRADEKPIKMFEAFNDWFERKTTNYVKSTIWMIGNKGTSFIAYFLILGSIVFFASSVPKAFLPTEDQGYFYIVSTAQDGSTIENTDVISRKIEAMAKSTEGVKDVVSMIGSNALTGQLEPNSVTTTIRLKNWEERKSKTLSADGLMKTMTEKLEKMPGIKFKVYGPPPIRGLSRTGGVQLWIQSHHANSEVELATITNKFIEEAKLLPQVKKASAQLQTNCPVILLDVDRVRAKTLGVSLTDLFETLQSTIGYKNVNQFVRNGLTYWVKVQSDAGNRKTPEDIGKISVKSSSGTMIPLRDLVTIRYGIAPARIDHFNGLLATRLVIDPQDGYSTGDVMDAMDKLSKKLFPSYFGYKWEGIAYQQQQAGDRSATILAFGLLMVFLILAAQYEAWGLPFAVIMAVPFGIFGAYAIVYFMDKVNDVYFQIGLLTLIALAAKNAILIVEFAELKRLEGFSIIEATKEAARMRNRPIIMTSLAFILGVLPLVISSGAGAESRHSIGLGVLGGMLAATFIARYFIPFLYFVVATLQEKYVPKKVELIDESSKEAAHHE